MLLRLGALALYLLLFGCGQAEAPPATAGASPARVSDDQVRPLLVELAGPEPGNALQTVVASGDPRFVSVLIELLRAQEIGIAMGHDRAQLVAALETLSGRSHGDDWAAWVRWYAGTTLEPPPGFTGWKGSLLSRIDRRFGPLLPFGAPTRIRVEEIVWGGVAYEGIPALDQPSRVPAAQADYLNADEPVFGVALGGEARAYPLRILDWHEMANDELGGVPLALAYCTLCGSGIAYDRRTADGRVFDFGSSGFLMRSNKLMVDRQTRSLWNQFTGTPVVGPLAEEELRLQVLPSVVTTWEDWRSRHPETTVLFVETGHTRLYQPGAAYADYFASPETMFPVPGASGELAPKARVFGLELEGASKAYPVGRLVAEGVVNDRVGEAEVVLIARQPLVRVEGRSVRSNVLRRYEAGAAVRAYRTGGRRFSPGESADLLEDAEGRIWRVVEEALVGPDGEQLPRQPGVLSYWFGWHSYHPDTLVFGSSSGSQR